MKDLIRDKDGKVCAAKIAYWLTLLVCFAKILTDPDPNYSGLALFLSPVAATYFGRNHTKAGVK